MRVVIVQSTSILSLKKNKWRTVLNPTKRKRIAVVIWPVTSRGFQNTKWLAVLYSQQISQNRKIPANLNYHMS